MNIEYIPHVGFRIDGKVFLWSMDRNEARKLLDNKHKDDDQTINLGDDELCQKRDIYENINESDNYFFFNYDEHNNLRDLEVHWGVCILVENIPIIFDEDIKCTLAKFKELSITYKELEKGEYLLEALQIVLATNKRMGGDDNGVGYFYCYCNMDYTN
jgi:hypothetical protein